MVVWKELMSALCVMSEYESESLVQLLETHEEMSRLRQRGLQARPLPFWGTTSGSARVGETGPRCTVMLGKKSVRVYEVWIVRSQGDAYFANGPDSTQPPPDPGGMQFRPVGRPFVQLCAS